MHQRRDSLPDKGVNLKVKMLTLMGDICGLFITMDFHGAIIYSLRWVVANEYRQ